MPIKPIKNCSTFQADITSEKCRQVCKSNNISCQVTEYFKKGNRREMAVCQIVAEWYTAPCLLRATHTVMGSALNLHQCLRICLQVHGSKRLGCHADLLASVTPEVNLRIAQARKRAKVMHPSYETQGRHHQKSKTGVSVAP